jgi:hypothetical protein
MRIIPEDSHLHTRRRENLNLTYYPIIWSNKTVRNDEHNIISMIINQDWRNSTHGDTYGTFIRMVMSLQVATKGNNLFTSEMATNCWRRVLGHCVSWNAGTREREL